MSLNELGKDSRDTMIALNRNECKGIEVAEVAG